MCEVSIEFDVSYTDDFIVGNVHRSHCTYHHHTVMQAACCIMFSLAMIIRSVGEWTDIRRVSVEYLRTISVRSHRRLLT